MLVCYLHPSLEGSAVDLATWTTEGRSWEEELPYTETVDEEKGRPWGRPSCSRTAVEQTESEEALCVRGTSKAHNWEGACLGNEVSGPRGA